VAKAEAEGLAERFAGSHPLAGTERSGFEASRADLFRDAVVYVTPTAGGETAAREVAHFWESVCGAHPVLLDAAAHDVQVALTSHVPQVVSSLLGLYLSRHLPAGASLGPGARDTTRLAGSEPGLWTEILLLNRDAVLPALRALEEPLGELERALESGDRDAVKRWLGRGSEWRRGLDRPGREP
jgi:prephenate dehydrogenase